MRLVVKIAPWEIKTDIGDRFFALVGRTLEVVLTLQKIGHWDLQEDLRAQIVPP